MGTTPRRAGGLTIVLLAALWGCGGDRPAEQTPPAAEVAQLTPEQQMQTALQRVVDAQARHHQDRDRYADSLQILIDDFGYQPVGEEQVALHFAERETDPLWGYVASAVHPFSNQRCEVLHGTTTDGRPFAGQITCEGLAADPQMPQQQPGPGTTLEAGPGAQPVAPGTGPDAQPVAPGTGPDAQRVTPPTEIDTVRPEQRRP